MMRRFAFSKWAWVAGMGLCLGLPSSASAKKVPTADELLAAMDQNMTFDTRTATIRMIVEGGRRTREFEIISYGRGEEDAAMEYRKPRREKGTRMLKLGDELWIYMPSIDRVQKISGHMLRQGMMGSDLSYEDMMASREMRDAYDAKVTGEEKLDGRPHWRLEMKAKDDTVTYPKRVTWIDVETLVPTKQELFALSGMKLKTWTMSEPKLIGKRLFPTRMVIQDHIKKDSKTTLTFSDMEFGIKLESEVFSLRWLERRR